MCVARITRARDQCTLSYNLRNHDESQPQGCDMTTTTTDNTCRRRGCDKLHGSLERRSLVNTS